MFAATSDESQARVPWIALFIPTLLLLLVVGITASQALARGEGVSIVRAMSADEAHPDQVSHAVQTAMAGNSPLAPAAVGLAPRPAISATLALGKMVWPIQVAHGGLVTFTVAVTNTGQTTGTVDAIIDTLDPALTFAGVLSGSDVITPPKYISNVLTWTGPFTLTPGSALTLFYQTQTPPGREPLTLCNQVQISTTQTPPAPVRACVGVEQEMAFAYLPQVPKDFEFARLIIGKQVSPGVVATAPDNEVVYTVAITNAGDTAGTLLAVTDTLPAGFTFLHMEPGSDVTANPGDVAGSLIWQGSWAMPPDGHLRLIYRVRPNAAAGQYTNRVVVAAHQSSVPRQSAVATLLVEEPIAGLTAGNDGPTWQGQSTTLSAAVTAGTNVVYAWDFGDGTTGGGSPIGHVYPAVGTYTAIVTARNGVSEQTASTGVTIEPAILLQEDFNDPGAGINRWTKFLNYWRLAQNQWRWEEADGVGGSGAAIQDCWLGGSKVAEDALLMYLGDGATDWTDYRVETKMLLRGGVREKDNGEIIVIEEGGYPVGLWVRGQYQDVGDSNPAGWVTGYYIIVGGKPSNNWMFIRLSQLQTLTDCWGNACDNPQNLYDFNNPHELHEVTLSRTFNRNQWYSLAVEVRGANIKVYWEGDLVIDYTDTKEPFLTGTVGFKTYKSKTVSFDDVLVTPLMP